MIPDVSVYRDNAASKVKVVESQRPSGIAKQSNKGFVKSIILIIVVLILLQIAGVDISELGAMATIAIRFLWEIFTVLFSFFIEIIRQAFEALRDLLGMRG